ALSGGLDSSAIAAFARECGTDLRGVTYGDPSEPESEGPMVALLARRYGLRVDFAPTRAETIAGAFRATVEAQDAPFASGSIIAQYLVFGLARDAGLKVLLGGQGSDEAFMGYRLFHTLYVRQLVAGGHPFRALRHLVGWLPSLSGGQFRAMLSQRLRAFQGRRVLTALPGLPAPARLDLGLGGGPLWHRALLDVTRFSLPTLLRYEDRNSMAHSVESRHPFMDHRLIEQGLSLTDAQRLAHGRGKWILRVGLKGRIPEEIRMSRQKFGFPANQGAAVAAGLGRVIREALAEVRPVATALLGAGVPIEARFRDDRLATEPARMAEAVTLYWLGLRG
ncbi:MAG TPA: asparagine synthase C-terminal domain-containing protein, partial [Gemmatimonadales bacterium]